MCELIHQAEPVARKSYDCMASEWLMNAFTDYLDEMTFAEKRAVVKARRNKWRILPGEKYVKQAIREDGVYTFRAIPAMHKICLRLEVYEC